MPDRDAHIQRARDNYEFYRHRLDLSQPVDCQWAPVVLFYAALHWVDAYFASLSSPLHPADHQVRNTYIAGQRSLVTIERHYMQLRDRADDARYRLLPFDEAHVRSLEVRHFIPLCNHIAPLL